MTGCLWCGSPLQTANRRARYCSASCRAKAHRHGPRALPLGDRRPKGADGEATAIVTRQLQALGVVDEDLGRAALACARAIDSPQTSSSLLPGLTRALEVTMRYLHERAGDPWTR